MAQVPMRGRRGTSAVPRRPVSPPIINSVRDRETSGSNESEAPLPRRQARPPRPEAPGIPTLYKISAAVALLLLLVAFFGYGPYMRFSLTKTIDTAPNVEDRKAAAAALVSRGDAGAGFIFMQRLTVPDEGARQAAVYGESLLARRALQHDPAGERALDDLVTNLPAIQDAPGKIVFAKALADVAKDLSDAKIDDDAKTKLISPAAKAVLPLATDSDSGVRAAAAGALAHMRAPGVCAALARLAEKDSDVATRGAARDGLTETALPDAAGALLKAISSTDPELSREARIAFAKVRDSAPSAELLPLLNDSDAQVRRAIIEALGKRRSDAKAAEGIAKALKDSVPENRVLALKALPVTGAAGMAATLVALIKDPVDEVRLACAQTLGEMRDDESKQALLAAFGTTPDEPTMAALLKSLGKRSSGKDLAAIAIVMKELDKGPASGQVNAGLGEALAALTNAGQGAKRDAERRGWTVERWKAWWANISAREKIRQEALDNLTKADARKQEDKRHYPELLEMTKKGLELLEKCKELSKADDPEDLDWFDRTQVKYSRNQELFFKHQSIDIRNQ